MSTHPRARTTLARMAPLPLLVLAAAGCSADDSPGRAGAQPRPPVVFVEIEPRHPNLLVGQAIRLFAHPTDEFGEDLEGRKSNWSSADAKIARVDPFGVVEAIAPGSTLIFAEVEGIRASTRVRIHGSPVDRVLLEPNRLEIEAGRTGRLVATPTDVWGKELPAGEIAWSSSAPEIAEVNESGEVSARKVGSATIFAEFQGVKGSATIDVIPVPVEDLLLLQDSIELYTGRAVRLEAVALDAEGQAIPSVEFAWTSSAPHVASVDKDGVVHGWRVGEATITAWAGGVAAEAEVRVDELLITRVDMEPPEVEIEEGGSATLTAIPIGSDGEPFFGRAIHWSSSDEAVAEVNRGVVQALKTGDVEVTASVGGVTGTALVKVLRALPPIRRVRLCRRDGDERPYWLPVDVGVPVLATVWDTNGIVVEDPPLEWRSSDDAIATVDESGFVIAKERGVVELTASIGGVTGSCRLEVYRPKRAERVEIYLDGENRLIPGEEREIAVRAYDQAGLPLGNWPMVWTSTDDSVATATAQVIVRDSVLGGVVRAHSDGEATIRAEVNGVAAEIAVSVEALDFEKFGIGGATTCALTKRGTIYCWGPASVGFARPVPTMRPFATTTFQELSVGPNHICAIDTTGAALCSGSNNQGQLGNGSTSPSTGWDFVAGGLSFSRLSAGSSQTCGVTTSGKGYCWGAGAHGLGAGPDVLQSTVPVPIHGGLELTDISTSIDPGWSFYTMGCGLTKNGRAHCWGANGTGEVGDGTREPKVIPVPSGGDLLFSSIRPFTQSFVGFPSPSVGYSRGHGCGVALDGQGYCWGANDFGQLGDGSVSDFELAPRTVTGGHRFREIHTGAYLSCGLRIDGQVLCWGISAQLLSELGPPHQSTVPAPVAGSMRFTTMALGASHACGMTEMGKLYCWGYNLDRRLGVGVTPAMLVPEPMLVVGQLPPVPKREESEQR